MAEEEFDFTLIGDLVVKPTTEESDDPIKVLTNKGVRNEMWFLDYISMDLSHHVIFPELLII